MEEIVFHYPENQFPPARMISVLKNWFPFISVTVSTSRKKLSCKVYDFHYRKSPSSIVGIKDSFKNMFP